jgi:hypothetical protein
MQTQTPTSVKEVTLVNKALSAGNMVHIVCGHSGKVYGSSRYSGKHGGHIIEMTMKDYEAYCHDIVGNTRSLQQWVPHFNVPIEIVADPSPKELDSRVYDDLNQYDLLCELLAPHQDPEDNSPSDTLKRIINILRGPSGPQGPGMRVITQELEDERERIHRDMQADEQVHTQATMDTASEFSPEQEDRIAEVRMLPAAKRRALLKKLGIEAPNDPLDAATAIVRAEIRAK